MNLESDVFQMTINNHKYGFTQSERYFKESEVLWFNKVRYFCEVPGYRLRNHVLIS